MPLCSTITCYLWQNNTRKKTLWEIQCQIITFRTGWVSSFFVHWSSFHWHQRWHWRESYLKRFLKYNEFCWWLAFLASIKHLTDVWLMIRSWEYIASVTDMYYKWSERINFTLGNQGKNSAIPMLQREFIL